MGLFGSKSEGSTSEAPSGEPSGATGSEGRSGMGGAQSRKSGSDPAQASGSSRGGAGRDGGQAPRTGGEIVANIGKSIIFKGELSGDEDLIIDGQVEGRITLPNNEVTIGAAGRITADIQGKSIIIIGKTAGNLSAAERIEVQATGIVEGDIRSPRLQIEEGAVVNGKIEMSKSQTPVEKRDASPTGGPGKVEEPARKSA